MSIADIIQRLEACRADAVDLLEKCLRGQHFVMRGDVNETDTFIQEVRSNIETFDQEIAVLKSI